MHTKYFASLLLSFFCLSAFSQKASFQVNNISLPPEISYYNNQFSGLCIAEKKLYFMSESRLQDSAEAKLYSVELSDLDHKMKDSFYVLPYRKYDIFNLDILRKKMKAAGDDYEGLEAIVIDGTDVYLSVETATPSNYCYLLKGTIDNFSVILNPKLALPVKKPVNANGSHIYNAGFEAIAYIKQNLYAFFEYNYFPQDNYVKLINQWSFENHGRYHPIFTEKIPFRVTDITNTGNDNKFTGINYFYKGGGDDAVYRVPQNETENNKLIKDSKGNYRSYCRLISIDFNGTGFTWKPLWEFPEEYWGYNWEGIAAYKGGYFIINDKYTPAKPYSSVLLYLSPEK